MAQTYLPLFFFLSFIQMRGNFVPVKSYSFVVSSWWGLLLKSFHNQCSLGNANRHTHPSPGNVSIQRWVTILVSQQPRPCSLLFSSISLAVSFRGVRKLWNVSLAEMKSCVSVLLSDAVICRKRRIPYPFCKHTAGRSCCNLTAFWSAPPQQEAEWGPRETRISQTVVVSFKIKDPCLSTPLHFLSHRTSIVNCVTSLF